jgi:uncharacterized protein (TIGR02145 family)
MLLLFSSCCDLFCNQDEEDDPNDPVNYPCGDPLVDERDGQSYSTVKIGDQCWMAENLNYGIFTESVFTNQSHNDMHNNGTIEKYAYDNDENNLDTYGGLYEWNELMDYKSNESGRGICPEGWHVPSYDEFVVLVEETGGWLAAGKALKLGGSSNFDFRLGGNRREKGNFTGGLDNSGSLWTSTISVTDPDTRAWNINFIDDSDQAAKATELMSVGKSCRCIRD